MPLATDRTVVQSWIDHELAQELREAAKASERTLSSEIRLAIRKHLEESGPAGHDEAAEDRRGGDDHATS